VGSPFASGKLAWGICDRCSFRYLLKELKYEIVKTKRTGLLVCASCWSPDHPQLQLGMWPISDPQALRNPRVDTSYLVSGSGGEGSRQIQWGWAPVGGGDSNVSNTPNDLVMTSAVGTVTVTTA
jgi:hypothetical protein